MSADEAGVGNAADTLLHAIDAYEHGELDTSRVLCEQHLRAEPANAVALMLLGLIAKKSLKFAEAIPLFERSVRIDPDPKALTSLADCLWRVGRLAEALCRVEEVVAGSPENLEALLLKAAILHGQRRFDDALECARSAERCAPASHLVAARLGCILVELGQYEAAENYFQSAVRLMPGFRHCSLINFRRSVWRQIAPAPASVSDEEFAPMRAADVHGPYDAVVAACCDARYFYKYGVTFVNSYAQNAAHGKLLHLHILDPDDGFAAYLETLIARLQLHNIVVTYEYAPVDEEPDFNLRRTFYSCARFLRIGSLLTHYQKTIACFDIDTVFEARLDDMLLGVGAADVGLVRREPPDSPWLDIVANIVIANNTERTRRYFSAVENFIRHFVGRRKLFWHLDQIALYCVLKMMERFDAPPRVASIAPSACGAVWHIGNPYEYRLQEYRVTRYQLADLASPP
jgi:tetratricopeptide (TPR) repeat protein